MTYWRQPLDRDRIQVPHGIVHIIEERCKGCGFCVEFCPQRVLVMSKSTNSKGYHPPELIQDTHCVNCGLCALLCPDFAIYVENGGLQVPDKVEPIHRGGVSSRERLRDSAPERLRDSAPQRLRDSGSEVKR